jgi:tRNA 2-thiouridine synthesizing protein A
MIAEDANLMPSVLRPDALLDARGLICPLPVLKARKKLLGMQAGDILQVMATDAAAVADFALFCEETGHHLLSVTQDGGVFVFQLRRARLAVEKTS